MKILIIRLSSLGDIILTTPVIRALKTAIPSIEIHFAVKTNMLAAIQNNPEINKFHILGNNWSSFIQELKNENFDYVLDLHNNLRSHRICFALQKPVSRFQKSNLSKWKMVWLKSKIEVKHVVLRYLDTLKKININYNPFEKLEFHISTHEQTEATQLMSQFSANYICIALGATFETKKWIVEHFIDLIQKLQTLEFPIVLLGGKTEIQEAEKIQNSIPDVINLVGKTTLGVSAAILKLSQFMITHDTGLMHIGAALGTKMCVIWGNTVSEFGMYPWQSEFISVEKKLPCRPCSRLGFHQCPQNHFNCMKQIKADEVLGAIKKIDWI